MVFNLCLDIMITVLSIFFACLKYVITSLLIKPTEISPVYLDYQIWQPWLLRNNTVVGFPSIIYVFPPNLLYVHPIQPIMVFGFAIL